MGRGGVEMKNHRKDDELTSHMPHIGEDVQETAGTSSQEGAGGDMLIWKSSEYQGQVKSWV